jgi:hypothetical protein
MLEKSVRLLIVYGWLERKTNISLLIISELRREARRRHVLDFDKPAKGTPLESLAFLRFQCYQWANQALPALMFASTQSLNTV